MAKDSGELEERGETNEAEKYGFFLYKGQTAFTFEANQFLRMCWISSEFPS